MSRSVPFLRPIDRVTTGEWITRSRGEPLTSAVIAWDYNTTVGLSRTVNVDAGGVYADCRIPADAPLAICVRAWTTGSQIRALLLRHPVQPAGPGQTSFTLNADIDGKDLGGTLQVETSLELADATVGDHPFSPRRPGTILWSDLSTVALEGNAGLLPISPVAFAEHPRLPDGAAWYVSLDFADWSAAAMGALLVLVNTDLPAVSDALTAGEDDSTAALLWSALGVDIVVDILARALDESSFPRDEEETSDSETLTVAGLVISLVRAYLQRPTETFAEAFVRARDLRIQDPSLFRAEIQRSLAFTSGVGG